VATLLHDAGYRTGLFGKYLNGYTEEDTSYVPPGWDRWFAFTDRNGNGSYYDNVFSVDGQPMGTGSGPEDYSTDVLAREAVSFIQGTPAETPVFVYLAVKAPHERATPAPGDEDLFGSLRPFRPPSFNEADVSDKPEYVRADDPLTAAEIELSDELRTNALRTLVAADRTVGSVLDALEAAGRMESTLVVFASDNGYLFGEHRRTGKGVPYEESIRIPMVVRFDALGIEPRADGRLVTNVDLTPTFLDAAGVPPPPMDGVSLLPMMASADASWRQDFLLEHLGEEAAYCGVRTEQETFVVYDTGEEELYDLVADQFELVNVASAPEFADVRASLAERLRALCDPPPLGVSPP
jgi:arylsulfatase A-like enzyme